MRIVTPHKKRNRPCPDCGSPLIRRTSDQLTLLITRTLVICKNPVCGASFSGLDEITHRISPPSVPNPDVKLPMSPKKVRNEILNSLTGEVDEKNNAIGE
ncbi:MAG: ogr/Delta-like zinc finger family protein [Pseudomonadota bacterium]|nr:ogr/Delta-like zinc finger family protein [Pseudomonadota bacterium]